MSEEPFEYPVDKFQRLAREHVLRQKLEKLMDVLDEVQFMETGQQVKESIRSAVKFFEDPESLPTATRTKFKKAYYEAGYINIEPDREQLWGQPKDKITKTSEGEVAHRILRILDHELKGVKTREGRIRRR